MSVFRFIISKTFWIQIALALLVIVILCFIGLAWLKHSTNHDQQIEVPDLSKMSLDRVAIVLDDSNLRYEVQDSANYNPAYPKYSVIEQSPIPGNMVKERRKIYLVLNPSGYGKVKVPNVIQTTKRQAKPILRALEFKIGTITYKPNIAKDMVLEMRYKGKTLQPGTQLMKTSTIDLVLGDGKRGGIPN